MNSEFAYGDVVINPRTLEKMTVEGLNEEGLVETVWVDTKNNLRRDKFNPTAIYLDDGSNKQILEG